MAEQKICLVKFKVNPISNDGYQISNIFQPTEKFFVVFTAKNSDSLMQIAENFRKNVSINGKHKVQFNFTSTPKEIRENKKLLATIRKICSGYEEDFDNDPDAVEEIIQNIQTHCKKYGNYPDFKDVSPEGCEKTVNYIKSVLGRPNLSKEIALVLAKKL